MLFLADVMLKKLARWLRILGVPTLYAGDYSEDDDEIIKLAMRKKAVLLTLDKKLFEKARDYVSAAILSSTRLERQLVQLAKEYCLDFGAFPARTICPHCNGAIKEVQKERVKKKVFAAVYRRHEKFWLCQNRKCGKVYWEGSHWKKIKETAARVARAAKNRHRR